MHLHQMHVGFGGKCDVAGAQYSLDHLSTYGSHCHVPQVPSFMHTQSGASKFSAVVVCTSHGASAKVAIFANHNQLCKESLLSLM